ncbi:U2 snRNP auxiliary factor small subunit [Entamoeba marina]
MAEDLANIHGTEKDKVNCSFFFKIGACRHGDACSRHHYRPESSPTILLTHLYENPLNTQNERDLTEDEQVRIKKDFNIFYEDIFNELASHGEIVELLVCGNLNEHMMGNVYVKFKDEKNSAEAMQYLLARYYGGKMIQPSYSHVTDFKDARCRQYETGICSRKGFCNFIHVIEPNHALKIKLFERQPLRRKRFEQTKEETTSQRNEPPNFDRQQAYEEIPNRSVRDKFADESRLKERQTTREQCRSMEICENPTKEDYDTEEEREGHGH